MDTEKKEEKKSEEKLIMSDIIYGMINAGILLQLKAQELKQTCMPDDDVPEDIIFKIESLYGAIIKSNFKHLPLELRVKDYEILTQRQVTLYGKESRIITPNGVEIN